MVRAGCFHIAPPNTYPGAAITELKFWSCSSGVLKIFILLVAKILFLSVFMNCWLTSNELPIYLRRAGLKGKYV